MKIMRKLLTLSILISYALGASTFSHMVVMDHPAVHTTHAHHESNSTSTSNTDDANKCLQLCKYIEQSKLSFLIAPPPLRTIIFSHYVFPVISYNKLPEISIISHQRVHTPPGNSISIASHLRQIKSTVLLI